MNNKKTAVLVGMALAGLTLVGSSVFADAKTDKAEGECHGINSCKGKGACGGVGHSCAGKNSCKGKGWMKMTEADCVAAKGSFKASK